MPTGYTADIKDGISFKTFAMNCARAFGACIELRDEPGGGDRIPDQFNPSDYHAKAAQKARDDLAALLAMTPEQRDLQAQKKHDEDETARFAMLEERKATRKAYEAMLAKVKAWSPPTLEHVGLHAFMREQIEKSIEFDCGGSYGREPKPIRTGEQWAADETARLTRDIGYHDKEHAEEVKRAASRTEWVRALRNSL